MLKHGTRKFDLFHYIILTQNRVYCKIILKKEVIPVENVEFYRNELDEFIKARGYNISDEEVVKKSLEIEKIVFNCNANQKEI